MKIDQLLYYENQLNGISKLGDEAQWVLIFGNGKLICNNEIIETIRQKYPNAYLMGCSTAGEIFENQVYNDSLSISAIKFAKAKVIFKSFDLANGKNNFYKIGQNILSSFDQDDLKHIFILCEGVNINGSKLVEGLRSQIKNDITISGGLAGDGSDFKKTYILANDIAKEDQIVVAAIYGDIKIGCASFGGWDTFGIERLVTKSKDNILYEMDGKPALDLYKEYLGSKAKELPASALLFPLSVRLKNSHESLVRTILSINEKEKSLIFAGDIPQDSYCKLMKSNTYNLVNGSMEAAKLGKDMINSDVSMAILVSCIGRKLVLKQRIDEEIEAVREIVDNSTKITGFYSYGEIAPYKKNTSCELHNQTMTVTFISEE